MSKTKFRSDTMGVVTNLSTKEGISLIDDFVKAVGDTRFSRAVDMAKASGIPFFIAAGRFGEKGFMAMSVPDEQDLLSGFCDVNEWLSDIKSKTTAWIVMPSLYELIRGRRV